MRGAEGLGSLPLVWGLVVAAASLGLALGLGKLTGWAKLARHYQTRGYFEGRLLKYMTIRVGFAAYKHCVSIGASHEGFYAAIWPIFSIGNPALLIPWADIRLELVESLFSDKVRFHIALEPDIEFYMLRRQFVKLQKLGLDTDVAVLRDFKA